MTRITYCLWQIASNRNYENAIGSTGCGNRASAQSSRQRSNVCAVTMSCGAFAALLHCVAVRQPSCARFGNGARMKQKRQIGRLFIFCKITSYWTRQRVSSREAYLITNIFPLAAVKRSARQRKPECSCPNLNGPFRGAASERDLVERRCAGRKSCNAEGTERRGNSIWSPLLLRRAARSRRSRRTKHTQQLCWFRGNRSCSE